MNLQLLYHEIDIRVKKIDFSTLWKGFHPIPFALYTQEECYLDEEYIEKTEDFCANTAIQFGDEYIAIWNVSEEPKDLDILTAKIIHEMFHAFQLVSGENRFVDDNDALFHYNYSAGNLSAKRKEASLIRTALEEDDPGAYAGLVTLRSMRAEAYPYEYTYEAGIEQIEGSANYVEACALEQLDPKKGKQVWKQILDRISRPENYFPIRIICYAIGAAVIACIRKYSDIDWEAFADQPFARAMLSDGGTPFQKARDDGKMKYEEAISNDAEMEQCRNHYVDETHRIIESAVKNNDCVLRGKYPLVSVNLWDARCEGNYITSNQFVMYQDGDAYHTLNGNFVVQVDGDYNILAVFRQGSGKVCRSAETQCKHH